MRKTTLQMILINIKGKQFWQVVVPKLGGGRMRKTFKLREDAKRYLDLARIQVENYGTAAMSISDGLRNEAIKSDELLAPFGKTITDAALFYIEHLKAISTSQSVESVIAALRAGREADRRSVRYLRDLKYRLGRFEGDFGERQIAAITTVEIEGWLRSLNLGPVSRNTFRRRLVTLFEFAKERGWCPSNPALPTAIVQEVSDHIGVLTPSEVAGLLAAASTETVPYWAIGAFAGLRASEIERLD
jgi:integrase